MKIKIFLFVFPLFMMVGKGVAQNSEGDKNLFSVTDAQIREYIEEVYGHEAEMVINHEQRMKDINDLLKNRFKILVMKEGYKQKLKEMEKLSSVPLLNFNNPNLRRDTSIDPKHFNPLKYNLNFYSSGSAVYAVGDSYIIFIAPQKRPLSSVQK